MAGYRRKIAYLYSYKDNMMIKNVGYVRMEMRERVSRFYIYIKGMYTSGHEECTAYILRKDGDKLRRREAGKFYITNSVGEYRMEYRSDDALTPMTSESEIGGVLLELSSGRRCITDWDGRQIAFGNIYDEGAYVPRAEKKTEAYISRAAQLAETPAPELQRPEPVSAPEPQRAESISVPEMKMAEPVLSMEQPEPEPIPMPEPPGPEPIPMPQPPGPEPIPMPQPPGPEPIPMPQPPGPELIPMPQPLRPEPILSPEHPWPEPSPTPQTTPVAEPQNIEQFPVREQPGPQPEPVSEPFSPPEPAPEPPMPRLRMPEPPPVPESSRPEPIKRSTPPPPQTPPPEPSAMPMDQEPAPSAGPVKPAAQPGAQQPSMWESLTRAFARIHPFEQSDAVFLQISPEEIKYLKPEFQILANNSFLLHGYYNYHYLILGRGERSYLLGVPGIYHEREQMMASMFGFQRFWPVKAEKATTGCFGYYMCQVGLA